MKKDFCELIDEQIIQVNYSLYEMANHLDAIKKGSIENIELPPVEEDLELDEYEFQTLQVMHKASTLISKLTISLRLMRIDLLKPTPAARGDNNEQ